MRVMVTSFGIEHSLLPTDPQKTIFHRMPPVSFRWINQTFMPDYELLLLCKSLIMDEASFDRLLHGSVAAYSKVADTFQALKTEGRIELRDFSATLHPHSDLLRRMLDQDIKLLDQWVLPLRESLGIWRQFSEMSTNLLRQAREEWFDQAPLGDMPATAGAHHSDADLQDYYIPRAHNFALRLHSEHNSLAYMSTLVSEALQSSTMRKRKEYRQALRSVLQAYLPYVDANLILASEFDVGFHDWLDFAPFYAAKFLSVGKDGSAVEKKRSQLEKLFTVPFPDLVIRDTGSLMRALNDRRVEDLRDLVAQAARGEVEFDDEFAKAVLREVFRESERAKRWRNVLGYATLPIGFIPLVGSPAQKAVEQGVSVALEKKMKRRHRWFYMLTEIACSKKQEPNRAVERDA